MRKHRVLVFGKQGCDKCKVLNQRLDTLTAKPDWAEFEKVYHDLETEDGLVAFCKTECVNPHRIPAFVVARADEGSGEYKLLPARPRQEVDPVCGRSRLYGCLGLETDYSDQGRGVITPKMIETVLAEARGG